MVMLPHLNPRLLTTPHVFKLQHMRLVSKEFSKLALAAVKTCTVHLGRGAPKPDTRHIARLMAEARLEEMSVTLTVQSGGGERHKWLEGSCWMLF